MALLSPSWLVVDLLIVSACFLIWKLRKQIRLPHPPGPPAKSWLTGNLEDVPVERAWLRFGEWAEKYGDIVYFRILDKPNVVVNRLEVANDLFDKRSNIYSSRPPAIMLKLMEGDWLTAQAPYADDWRAQRRMFQQYFSHEASRKYEEVQTRKIHDLLSCLLTTPEDFQSHIQHLPGAVIMSLLYDHDVAAQNDYFIAIAKPAIENMVKAITPGAFLVNNLPILRLVPEWFPGASFKRFAKEAGHLNRKMLYEPADMVRKRMSRGTCRPCITGELLERDPSDNELKNTLAMCATAYVGGADTSVTAVQTFFYAMVNNEDVQKKAQEEIDRVIGNERLPTFEDRSSLPYIEAVCRESLRWHPILPLGLVHYTTEEDIYNGYYIPKGTAVIPNVWQMTRDVSKYEDPDTFNPSRFFNQDSSLNDDDLAYVFGFGRRICPGRHVGLNTLWLTIATVLATFNIRKPKDALGQEIPVDAGYDGEFLNHPLPFDCAITIRSELAKQLIQEAIAARD